VKKPSPLTSEEIDNIMSNKILKPEEIIVKIDENPYMEI
jgi:uncharacterized protein (DUF4213/DUF364 family)